MNPRLTNTKPNISPEKAPFELLVRVESRCGGTESFLWECGSYKYQSVYTQEVSVIFRLAWQGRLNNTLTMLTPMDMLHGKGKAHGSQPWKKSFRDWGTLTVKEMVFLGKSFPDSVSVPRGQHIGNMYWLSRWLLGICVYTYMHIHSNS